MRRMSIQNRRRLGAVVVLIVVWFAGLSLATLVDLLTLLWYVYFLWKQEEQSESD